jgi:hypothetical protein
VQKTLNAGKEPKSLVTLYFTGTWEWSLEEMSYLNLLEDYLDIRLREVLREDKGGTYGVNVSITPRRAPVPEYSIEVSFGTAPARVNELLGLLEGELSRLKTIPPAETDVAKVKEQRFRLLERGRKENGFWRYFLTQELYYRAVDTKDSLRTQPGQANESVQSQSGVGADASAQPQASVQPHPGGQPRVQNPFQGTLFDLWEQTARSLTPQMLQERVRRYFEESRMLAFILEPESNAER